MSRLRVWANMRPMGWFGFEAGQYYFEYDTQWLALPEHFCLAPNFPLDSKRYEGALVKFFFQNLLPEGPILEAIAIEKQIALDNLFLLLAELGRDCAGALALLPENQAPQQHWQYAAMDLGALRMRLADRARHPLLTSGREASMSLAGAQDKAGVRFDVKTETLWEPLPGASSTHILKPENRNERFIPCVVNEYLCMKLAQRLKLDVPEVYLLRLPEPVLIIARYDRITVGDRVVRLHQIDFCQLLGKDGFFKYERNSRLIGLPVLFSAITRERGFATPAKAKLRLADWVIFNYLIGNADAHAKNLSVLVAPEGLTLAPFYDLLCVRIYDDERLALYIGDAESFDAVSSAEWEAFCADCGLSFPEFKKRLLYFVKKLPEAFATERRALRQLPMAEAQFVERMEQIIGVHLQHVESALGKVP